MPESVSFFSDSEPIDNLYSMPQDYIGDPVYMLAGTDCQPGEESPAPEQAAGVGQAQTGGAGA